MPPAIEHCANCGRTIGALETPRVFADHVVCAECWTRLSNQATPPPIPPPGYYNPAHSGLIITTERTSKVLKIQHALAVVSTIFAIPILFVGLVARQATSPASADAVIVTALGGILLAASLLWLIVVRVMIWWRHG